MIDPRHRPAKASLLVLAAALIGLVPSNSAPAQAQSLPGLKLPKKLPGVTRTPSSSARSTGVSAASQRKEQRRQGDLVKTVFNEIKSFRPNHREFIADNGRAQLSAMKALDDFREQMAQAITTSLVAMANDQTNSYATRTKTAAERHANYTSRAISAVDLDKFRNSSGRDDLAIAQYFLMAFRAEQMDQLARLYPDSQSVSSARDVAAAAMNDLGSLASVKQGRAQAQAARVAAMRLSPAVRRNAAAERDFGRAWKSSIWTQDEFAQSQVLRVNLLSSGWTVRRNPITGIILSRDQQAALAVKRPDGKCFSYVIVVEQKSNGGGFGGTYMASGRDNEMLCENAAK